MMLEAIFVVAVLFIVISFLDFLNRKKVKRYNAGTIIINTTDPSKDVIRIELNTGVEELLTNPKVEFDIKNESQ